MPAATAAKSLESLYASIADELERTKRIFDDELASEMPFINEFCDVIRSYRGKMLRPALLLLSAQAADDCGHVHHVLAAVVEMVHMATLVHDDVLDEADVRRRHPTIATLSGNTAAVLLGDYLISHAFHLCCGLGDPRAARRIGAATNVVCEGELLQNFHRRDPMITESVYFDIIARKTAALTAVACELGARYAGAPRSAIAALSKFGKDCGIAFQIVDDVLDIVGDESRVGKTLGQDLALGKLTLPMIHFRKYATTEDVERVTRAFDGEASVSAGELHRLLEAWGSLDYALDRARGYVREAKTALATLPPGAARQSLAALAEFIVARES